MNTVTVVKPIIHLFPLGPCSAGVFFHNTRRRKKTMTTEEKEALQRKANELMDMAILYDTPKKRERIALADLCETILAYGNDELTEAYAANLNKEYSEALHERFVANFGTPSEPRTLDDVLNAPPSAFVESVFDVLRKIQ